MHTRLGTEHYMAPEFWIKEPDGKSRYKKSVDIFALGLTFQAILKAEQGVNLKPVAEGCTAAESTQCIGSIMYTRHVYKQPDLDVVLYSHSDSTETKHLKDLIRQATLFKPEDRLTSSEILDNLLRILNVQHDNDHLNEIGASGNVRSAPDPVDPPSKQELDRPAKQGQSKQQADQASPGQQVKNFISCP